MLARMTEFLIGNIDSATLQVEIKNSKSNIIEKDFGKIGGKVFFLKPSSDINMSALLDQLDTQPNGRKAMEVANFFVGGPFIVTRTDNPALDHHQLFALSLSRPKDYIQFTLKALENFLKTGNEFNLRELATFPIRTALAKGLFDIDSLSPEFEKALQSFSNVTEERDESFGKKVLFNLIGAYYASFLMIKPSFKAARERYISSAEQFIDNQSEKILNDFKIFAANGRVSNILTLSIIELIKEEYPACREREKLYLFLKAIDKQGLNKYLKDAYIRTIPASLLPGNNIITLITCALTALAHDEKLSHELRNHISTIKLFDPSSNIQTIIESDRKNGGLLHCLYLESLRRESLQKNVEELTFDSLIWRYTNQEINIEGNRIPPKSMIAILNSLPRFDPTI